MILLGVVENRATESYDSENRATNSEGGVDLAIVGAGAAGLMTAICAGRSAGAIGASPRIVALDGAERIGAKILVAGGGRCNVTHYVVDETAYAGSTRPAIRNVLRRFDADATVDFFRGLGVELKREGTGKLFPVTDSARTVLDALLRAAHDAGVEIRTGHRVRSIDRMSGWFLIRFADSSGADAASAHRFPATGETPVPPTHPDLFARRVVLATGGMSLPKTGSDGWGYTIARSLGHTVTPRIFPALVPLSLPEDHFSRTLAGVSTTASLEVRAVNSKRLARFTGSLLFTHFGVSGPVVLDISRHDLDARAAGEAALIADWLPESAERDTDAALRTLGSRTPGRWLAERMPDRLARALCEAAGVDPGAPGASLRKAQRAALLAAIHRMTLPVAGSRGFRAAEVTAGGVPLAEVRLDSMGSRVSPGLRVVGEILDVDGRIGGFNFQWAWATGFIAGSTIEWRSDSSAEIAPAVHSRRDVTGLPADHG